MSEGSSKPSQQEPSAAPGFWGIAGGFTFAMAALLGPQLLLGPLLPLIIGLLPVSTNNMVSVGRFVLEGISILLIIAVVKLYGAKLSNLGITKIKPRYLLFTLVGFLAYYVLAYAALIISMAFLPIDHNQTQELGYIGLDGIGLVVAFVALVIITPFAEELIFRGFMYTGMRRRLPFWAASLVVSMLFAWVHGQWNVAIDVFMLSLVLCALRERSGSLWPSIFLHMVKNAIAFYLLYLYNG